jgi:plastocyanin
MMRVLGGRIMRSTELFSGSPTKKRKAWVLIAALSVLLGVGVLAASCGGGTTATTKSPATTAGSGTTLGTPTTSGGGGGGGAAVTIKGFAFDPATVTIKVGETVNWTNQDSPNHTVVGDNNEFKSGALATGATFSFKFETAGTYAYHCSIHPSMTGTVVVQ